MKNIAIMFLAVFIASGCTTRERYLNEVETPAGSVPPLPEEFSQKPKDPTALPSESSYANPVYNLAQNQQEDSRSLQQLSKGTINRFRKVYQAQGKPRIAIFLNQELSDEVREWTGPSKFLLNQKEGATAKRKTMVLGVDKNSETSRLSPNEPWVWDFEDGFVSPLLSAGATLVDRATIMRLSALKSKKPGSAFQGNAKRTIEMDSLLDFSDIFVEVLITRSPSAQHGYEFKSSAKEVRTGVILANVSSTRWPKKRKNTATQNEVITTSEGYELVHSHIDESFPTVADVSADLSLDLMNALIRIWRE